MGTYVTDTGFLKPTLVETKIALQSRFRAAFGDDLDTDDTTPAGLLIAELAKALSDAADADQELYTSTSPDMATGAALDRLCSVIGIQRLPAAPAYADVACYTDGVNEGLVITPGKQVRRVRGNLVLSLATGITISRASCRDIFITTAVVAGGTYQIVTSLGTFSVTVPGGETDPEGWAYTALASAFTAAQTGGAYAQKMESSDEDNLSGERCLRITSPLVSFSFTLGVWVVELVGSTGVFTATAPGEETIAAEEIYEIVTSQTNWLDCLNLAAGAVGRDTETDEELRLRRAQSFRVGRATEDSIRQAIYTSVPGVTDVRVVSNRTMAVDSEGRPPKSYEAIVANGEAFTIARTLWEYQPAGIESYGNQTVFHTDSQGTPQLLMFSRPVEKTLDVELTYSVYPEEEFPGTDELKRVVVEWAAVEYSLGKDVIPGRVQGAAYQVPGIDTVTARVRWHGSPTWLTTHLPVTTREYAYLATENITVVLV